MSAGGANHESQGSTLGKILSSPFETLPAIFACKVEKPQAKFAKIKISKEGIAHQGDSMSIFVVSGQRCEPGSPMAERDLAGPGAKNEIGRIEESGKPNFVTERYRISDGLSDPSSRIVCVVVYCLRTSRSCNFDAEVSIYESMCSVRTVYILVVAN